MKRFFAIFFLVSLVAGSLDTPRWGGVQSVAAADELWRVEFDQVCGQTENAADMSTDELKKAVERCDKLKPQIEALEASPRKVFLKRLQMCRNLFTFLLEGKEKK